MVNSPEFRKRMQRMERDLNDATDHIGRSFDDTSAPMPMPMPMPAPAPSPAP
jgi:hypothetical protein